MTSATRAVVALLTLIVFALPYSAKSQDRPVSFTIKEAQRILDSLQAGNVNRSVVEIQRSKLADLIATMDSYERELAARDMLDSTRLATIDQQDSLIHALGVENARLTKKLRRSRGGFVAWMQRIGLTLGGYYLGNRYPLATR